VTSMLPEVEHALVAAAARPQRRRVTRKRIAAVGVVVMLAGGSAIAATAPWTPVLGNPGGGFATATQKKGPPQQTTLLAVLRRPQNAADRGPDVQETLRSLVASIDHGVRLSEVRKLGSTSDGKAVVLTPEMRFGDDEPGPRVDDINDALCIEYPLPTQGASIESTELATGKHVTITSPGGGVARGCFSSDNVRNGTAITASGGGKRAHTWGLVPDGIAHVEVAGIRVPVENNFFDVPAVSSTGTATWYDPQDHVVSP